MASASAWSDAFAAVWGAVEGSAGAAALKRKLSADDALVSCQRSARRCADQCSLYEIRNGWRCQVRSAYAFQVCVPGRVDLAFVIATAARARVLDGESFDAVRKWVANETARVKMRSNASAGADLPKPDVEPQRWPATQNGCAAGYKVSVLDTPCDLSCSQIACWLAAKGCPEPRDAALAPLRGRWQIILTFDKDKSSRRQGCFVRERLRLRADDDCLVAAERFLDTAASACDVPRGRAC